jgi:hypothetical protein
MDGERYRVDVEFAARMPAGSMGRRVSKFESLLPGDARVRLVREAPDAGTGDGGTGEVEVYLNAASPAKALRDVALAVELVGSEAANEADEGNPFADVRYATVARVSEAPPPA